MHPGSCLLGGYGKRVEQLRVVLHILQEAHNQIGLYVINPMHVLLETDTPKHLLIVGPFDASDAEAWSMGNQI
jgi:hypothetical protein